MEVTRRYWEAVGTALALAALAVAFDRPLLLWGTAGVAGWVLARQVAFRRRAAAALEGLTASLSLDRRRVRTGTPVALTLLATLAGPARDPTAVRAPSPVGATGPDAEAALARGDHEASATVELSFPFAGRYRIGDATATVTDAGGWFRAVEPVAASAPVVVDPRRPREVALGGGGDAVAATYGDHRSGGVGAGTVPAEVRRYVPGDDVRRIDWPATARLDEVYVREYEAESDRTTALLVDAGPAMATGPPGETQLDYAAHVGLTLLEVAADAGDPVGLFVLSGDGEVRWDPPASSPAHYAAIRDALHGLETRERDRPRGGGLAVPGRTPPRRAALLGPDSPFAERLRPLLGRRTARHARVAGDPLVEVARVQLRRLQGTVWTAIVTDDAHRARLTEAVRAARRGNDRVAVFLLPDVLFEPGGLADVDAAYERYRDVVAFRRELDRLDRVTVLEVGPTDRVDALLRARRRRGEGRV